MKEITEHTLFGEVVVYHQDCVSMFMNNFLATWSDKSMPTLVEFGQGAERWLGIVTITETSRRYDGDHILTPEPA